MQQPPAFSALGTSWWIEIGDLIDERTRTIIYDDCALLASTFSNTYSRFKPESLISQLNQHRELENPTPELCEMLTLGQNLFQTTGGVFNCLLGEHLVARGYDSNYSFIAKTEPQDQPDPTTDIHITNTKITLMNGSIDLGGFGKGYLIDLLARHLKERFQLTEFLINGGGDLYGTTLQGEPIAVHLEHPTEPGHYLGTTTIMNQGFAASSPHKRTWRQHGVTHTHIVGTVERDATLITTPHAVTADALATTALIANESILTTALAMYSGELACYTINDKRLIKSPHFPFKPL